MPDLTHDRCVYCTATGCLTGAAEHAPECPFSTGLWPVEATDVWSGAVCHVCLEPFVMGDVSVQVSDPGHPAMGGALPGATFAVCIGCAALRAVIPNV